MKKKTMWIAALLPLICSSCVVYTQHEITGNPVGNKVGYVPKSKINKEFSHGITQAARNGQITKIATVDLKYYLSGKVSVKVTGE